MILFQDAVLRYYESKGAAKSKLIMGIPFYGQSFTLQSSSAGYGAKASGPGSAGKWTKQRGMLAFYEICTKGTCIISLKLYFLKMLNGN